MTITVLFLIAILLALSVALVAFKPFEIVKASGVELISEDSSFGKSYGDWVAEYWKWWISIPENQSSINHPNKVTCLMHDTGAVIFFFHPLGIFTSRLVRSHQAKLYFLLPTPWNVTQA